MALWKRNDRDKKREWQDSHKHAMKAAAGVYSFWGETQSAYDTYVDRMVAGEQRPISFHKFEAELKDA